ncbi:MAG: hypothetical protein JSV52_09805 [Candidatus Zixiibacteriota bacterium]|nr:MAG: hypothetical protein JSV52_09805 [candidate division Zixibacteria bacterium]
MFRFMVGLIVVLALLIVAGSAAATEVSVKISGPGAVNDSTIKAGEPVSFDIYIENDRKFTCFTMGFKMISKDIKKVVHVADTTGGLNERGDVKGYNGWQDASIYDLGGVYVIEADWDGTLPEVVGFGGLCAYKKYEPHDLQKCLSWDLRIEQPGSITVDSSYFSPGGKWIFGQPAHEPAWKGPYTFLVVQ